jgi:hypothetical protein
MHTLLKEVVVTQDLPYQQVVEVIQVPQVVVAIQDQLQLLT